MTKLKCVANEDYKVSLVIGREYETTPDKKAHARGRVRVIDESGASYLFPRANFVVVADLGASERSGNEN
jgi:hypothetical protein